MGHHGDAARPTRKCNNRARVFRGSQRRAISSSGHGAPAFAYAGLPAELLNKRGRTFTLRVGKPIPPDSLAPLDESTATRYLRWRTYLLAHRVPAIETSPQTAAPIARPASGRAELEREIRRLPESSLLLETREFEVRLAAAAEIPRLLGEIGRLRETTFRRAGEGTGCAQDLDDFDDYYGHLFLWHKENGEIAAAYRIGNTRRILTQRGPRGLYTNSLFHFNPSFFRALGPSLELGRSFICVDYQRQFAPLFLLWKGLAQAIIRDGTVTTLFGPVSISNDYHPVSRQLLVRYFLSRDGHGPLCRLVRPRNAFRPPRFQGRDGCDVRQALRTLDDLAEPISQLDGDGKGIPVLLRQYDRMGARFLAFSVDSRFGQCLDGLALVDLRRSDSALLERYMGRTDAAAFRASHGVRAPVSAA
jgi:putative hemolysin